MSTTTLVPWEEYTFPSSGTAGTLSTLQYLNADPHSAVSDFEKPVILEFSAGMTRIQLDPVTKSGMVHIPFSNPPTTTSPLKLISFYIGAADFQSATATIDEVLVCGGGDVFLQANDLGQNKSFVLSVSNGKTYQSQMALCVSLGMNGHATSGDNFITLGGVGMILSL